MVLLENVLKIITFANLYFLGKKLQNEMEYPQPSTKYSREKVTTWLSRSAFINKMLDTVLQLCFPIHFVSVLILTQILTFSYQFSCTILPLFCNIHIFCNVCCDLFNLLNEGDLLLYEY